eukprot:TRINITY_DN4260_c0_g1_i3.p1 TRINITY_DN4260_c0_g1~~TRINITY_DN4260_c0_g1_i3.p1  ORF type:complete len:394 (-),score=45.86 TRINITY_DN4260_c0_g1_i3:41-1222(-)
MAGPPTSTTTSSKSFISKYEKNFDLPKLVAYPPFPSWKVFLIFFIGATVSLNGFLFVHRETGWVAFSMFAIIFGYMCLQALSAYLSIRTPRLAILCNLFIFILPWGLPSYHSLLRYTMAAGNMIYFIHTVELYRFQDHFRDWNFYWRALFLASYLDVRDFVPLPESTKEGSKGTDTLWRAVFKGYLHHVGVCTYRISLVGVCAIFVAFLPSPGFEFSLYSPWLWWAFLVYPLRWVGGFFCVYHLLEMLDSAYGLVYLMLGLNVKKSQNTPLSMYYLREFWGGHWNRNIHDILHRNFYQPFKQRGLPGVGLFAAFAASAILHIYPAAVALVDGLSLLYITLFFLIHALLMVIEKQLNMQRTWRARVFTVVTGVCTLPLLIHPFFLIGETFFYHV